MPLNIVLLQPEIPQNTGNIARSCAATGAILHLVSPLGFTIDDAKLKRAGLDYWHLLDIRYYDSTEHFFEINSEADCFFLSTKAKLSYHQTQFPKDAFIVFGRETGGIDEQILKRNYDRTLRIPMREGARSLNLSNSVAIVLYEALRQENFEDLQAAGYLQI